MGLSATAEADLSATGEVLCMIDAVRAERSGKEANGGLPPGVDPRAVQLQHVTKALVAVSGTGYAINDTINLTNGVVLKVATLTAGNGVISTTIQNAGSVDAFSVPLNPVAQVTSSGAGTGAKFNLTWTAGPPPLSPVAAPVFPPVPPDTAPVPIPAGPLAPIQVAPAAVPPSTAGFPLIRYATGSATTPASYFTKFTTTFPVPTIVTPIAPAPLPWNGATKTGAVWDNKTPPSTPSTAPIIVSFAAREADDDAGSVRGGHSELVERHAGSVLPGADPSHLHQPSETPDRRSKRMPPRDAPRRPNNS